jgi:hypothetical protein
MTDPINFLRMYEWMAFFAFDLLSLEYIIALLGFPIEKCWDVCLLLNHKKDIGKKSTTITIDDYLISWTIYCHAFSTDCQRIWKRNNNTFFEYRIDTFNGKRNKPLPWTFKKASLQLKQTSYSYCKFTKNIPLKSSWSRLFLAFLDSSVKKTIIALF